MLAKTLKCDESGGGYGRSLFKRDVGRLQRQSIFGNRHILSIGAAVVPLMATDTLAEHLITLLELRHVLANRLDVPRHIRSRNRMLWFEQAGPHEAQDVRQTPHEVPDIWMDGSRVNPYQHFFFLDRGLVEVLEV